MREIKFRAYLWTDRHTNDGMIYSDEMGMIEFWKNYLHYQGKKKLMQYTGLKDKNGREIYEGDIVKGAGKNPIIYIVEWLDSYGGFAFVDKEKAIPAYEFLVNFCEVIGNIYENPELLKEVEK